MKRSRSPNTNRPSHPAVFSITCDDVTIVLSSVNYGRESQRNERWLRRGVHGNSQLQAGFNRTGTCEIIVLEQCEASNHVELRRHWKGVISNVNGNAGMRKNYERTPETLAKLSSSCKLAWSKDDGTRSQALREGLHTYWNSNVGRHWRQEASNLMKSGLSIGEASKLATAKANSMKDN